jgi:hypothetical protein
MMVLPELAGSIERAAVIASPFTQRKRKAFQVGVSSRAT